MGDTIIVISYADYDDNELSHYALLMVHVDSKNRIIAADSAVDVMRTGQR